MLPFLLLISSCFTGSYGVWRCQYFPDEFILENPNTGEWNQNQQQPDWRDVRKQNASLTPKENVIEVMEKLGVTQMVEYLRKTGLDEVLVGDGPFTIFAPINHSFASLSKDLQDNFTSDSEYLRKVLQYHIVSGRKMSLDLKPGDCLRTLVDNASVAITYTWNNRLRVNDAFIMLVDAEAKNGVVHILEGVLLPPEKSGCPLTEYQPPRPQYNNVPLDRDFINYDVNPSWDRRYGPPPPRELPNYYPWA